jgi:glycerol-3-phosphate acyltransferase PlsY
LAWNIAAAIVIAYLLGSVPFAYIVAHLRKDVDIRAVGGGNVGALNTYRQIGPVWGLSVLAADILKGVLAVFAARWLGIPLEWVFVAGFAAIVGHNWPVFLKFRGGKGAATVLGVLVALTPAETFIAGAVVIGLIGVTRNPRLALGGLVLIPLLNWLFDRPLTYIYFALGLLVFIGLRTLVSLVGELKEAGMRKNLIIDRDYTAWQTRKDG